jgi:hypothetical protein
LRALLQVWGDLTDSLLADNGAWARDQGQPTTASKSTALGSRSRTADELASTVKINVDDLNRVNPDTPGNHTTPATGFGFRFDYAGAGDFTIRASHGDNYQPPLPTLAQTAEAVTRPRRANGMAWTEKGQPEAVTQYGVVSNGTIYASVATSLGMVQFTSEGIYLLTGSGGSSSAGFDWSNSRIDSQTMLRGPKACCRLGDIVYAATNNGVVTIDGGGSVREISTSALGLVGVQKAFSQTDKTTLIADEQTGDIYCCFDNTNFPYVYSTRWNKWSRVFVAPNTIECAANVLGVGMVFGYISTNTLQCYKKSLVNYQEQLVRFQPNFCSDQTTLKRFVEIEFYFNGSAFGQPITVLLNKMTGQVRTLREHEGSSTPTFIQAGIDSSVQGDTAEFSLAQTVVEVPKDAPCISNSLSFGFVTPAGTVKYTFYGATILANMYEKTVRRTSK